MNPATFLRGLAAPSLLGLRLAHPERLYLLVLVAAMLVYSLGRAREGRRWIAPLLRAVALAMFVLALAEPGTVAHSEGVTRPVLVDTSASITPAMRAWEMGLLREQLGLHRGDPVILFAGAPVATTLGGAETVLWSAAGCTGCDPGATDLETALEAIAADPATRQGPIALVTDGWENRGTAQAARNALRAAGIQLDIFTPPGAVAIPNVAMTQLTLPPTLDRAGAFTLGATLQNLNPMLVGGIVQIDQNGAAIERRRVTLPPGETRLDFPVRAEQAGLARYRATFKPDNPAVDTYTLDDTLEGWVGIGAQRKILILTASARDAGYLDTAVRRIGLQPTVVNLSAGAWDGNPKGFDAVILNNVARARLTPPAQDAIVRYVDGGGALAMVGGDQSFGLGGYENSSLAKILPVVMKPPEHREHKRALVLIIDKSGSMGRQNKLTYAKAAAMTVTKTLGEADLVGVIGFDSQPFEVIPLEPVAQVRPYFSQLINRLAAHGTTYLLPALQEADRTLRQSGASLKHVVILTDGETGGTAAMYYDLVSSMHHENGATISAIAIGREANLQLLAAIAKYGGGGFYQTDSPANLPELFLEDVHQRGGGDTTMVEKSFMPFSVTPDPILHELAGRRLPPLKGYVATDLKPGASLSMFVERDGRRSPIMASWRYGAGRTLAMTTDASGRWSGEWVRDGIFVPIWDKVMSWMAPTSAATAATAKFTIALGYRAGRITINLTDYSENASSASRPLDALVTAPDGAQFDAILTQQAAGELSGSFEASRPGTYNIVLKPSAGSVTHAFPPLAYTVASAANAELPRPAANYGLLENLASATGGRLNPSPHELVMSRPLFERTVSLNPWLIVTAMVLLIGEALIRRLTF